MRWSLIYCQCPRCLATGTDGHTSCRHSTLTHRHLLQNVLGDSVCVDEWDGIECGRGGDPLGWCYGVQQLRLCRSQQLGRRHELADRRTEDEVRRRILQGQDRRNHRVRRAKTHGIWSSGGISHTDDAWHHRLELAAGRHVSGHQAELGAKRLRQLRHRLSQEVRVLGKGCNCGLVLDDLDLTALAQTPGDHSSG